MSGFAFDKRMARLANRIQHRLKVWFTSQSSHRFAQPRKQILAMLLVVFLTSALILAALNLCDWSLNSQESMLAYVASDVAIAAALGALWLLNKRGHTRLAAHLCLNLIIFGTIAFFDPSKTETWTLFLALPVLVSSFILSPVSSFLYSGVAALGFSAGHLLNRPDSPYPYISILALFILAAVSYLISARYDSATAQILRLDRQFHAMFERVPVGLFRSSPEGTILEANRTLVKSLGFPDPESLIGSNVKESIVEPTDQAEGNEEDGAGEDGAPERLLRRRDGTVFWGSWSTRAVRDETGQVLYFEGCLVDIDRLKRTEAQVRQRAQQFAGLYEVARDLGTHHDLQALLGRIVDHAIHMAGVSGGGIYLYDPKAGTLRVEVAQGMAGIQTGTTLNVNEGLAGRVAHTHQPLIVEEYQTWEHRSLKFTGLPIRGALGVPMLYNGHLIGVLLVLEGEHEAHTFTDDDMHLLSLLASLAAVAVNNARQYSEAVKRLQQLESLRNIEKTMSASADLRLTLTATLNEAAQHLKISALDILTVDPYKHALTYAAGIGFRSRTVERFSISLNDCPYHELIEGRKTIQLHQIQEGGHEILHAREFYDEGFQCYVGIPLIIKGQVVGILEAFDRDHFERDEEWHEFLDTLGQQAAIAIDNANLFEDLARSNTELSIAYETTLEGWSRALDLRDQETEGHTRRVTQMTVALASFLGIRDYELLHIRRGALLHDIGKMGIPDEILLKPGPFSEVEWSWMHKHPRLAYEMLYPIRYLHPALDIPYCHHERWDGSGYPRGLKGTEIPLAARLFAVVDVWDAMTSNRPYRAALTRAEANQYLREQSGKHFDPEAVNTFFKYYGES